ncbi:MAG: hypothetical protein Alpg2KO_20590 [Alphaproteobacteria bacterium]
MADPRPHSRADLSTIKLAPAIWSGFFVALNLETSQITDLPSKLDLTGGDVDEGTVKAALDQLIYLLTERLVDGTTPITQVTTGDDHPSQVYQYAPT